MSARLKSAGMAAYDVPNLGQLAKAARAADEGRARRDDIIRRLRAEGASLRELAAAAGMSHSGIVRVLERGDRGARS